MSEPSRANWWTSFMTMPGVLQGDSGLGKNAFRSTEQGAISYFVGGEGVKPQKMPG